MRKLFTERARIVIYLEKSDELRMTAKAKENGELLAEWARNVLRNELTMESIPLPDPPATKPKRTPHSPRSSGDVRPPQSPTAIERDDTHFYGVVAPEAICQHRKYRGELCYKCDPKFGLPSLI